ncbi:DUF4097 family beta strand repeat-containing protein [Glutamicibacter protophormiae]|uniref:DUF4097 family beta strand repeat-containing protein n=1 Tax=Glutamicibacter protophormiae TaxID=37930 RepID=UPI0019598D02|nr:DUF4097 family beta strand repeat-containing protein [Glutamicibacter protophormiae]QRQ78222.1 DUF4097 family beta strand repeat protein [Glutamicibacter protophormiae]
MSTQTLNPLPPQDPAPRGSAKTLNIILAVIGVLALLTMAIGAARDAAASLSSSHVVQTADARGLASLDVEASSGTFTLEFSDTTEAVLDVQTSSGSGWTLRRSGDELVVRPPAGWNNFCFFSCTKWDNQVTLTLPRELNNGQLDAKFDLGAGEFRADGNFKDLGLDVGAGDLTVNGAASTLDATLGAGRADLTLDAVESAKLDVSAGRMDAKLTGSAPSTVTAQVSAGMLNLTLPDTSYNVASDVSAGSVENKLDTSSSSPNKVTVDVSAGSAVLLPGAEANSK